MRKARAASVLAQKGTSEWTGALDLAALDLAIRMPGVDGRRAWSLVFGSNYKKADTVRCGAVQTLGCPPSCSTALQSLRRMTY